MVINMNKLRKIQKNKGFTLVELIVVLVILAILAAILVPALLGYIDRAKQQKSVSKIHDLQVAATASLVEFYAFYDKNSKSQFTTRKYKLPNNTYINANNVTNYTFAQLQTKKDSDNACSDAVAKHMLQYLDSGKNDAKTYTFVNYGKTPWGVKASEVAKSGAEGLIILFGENKSNNKDRCKILFIQYSDLDGNLYSYYPKSNTIDVEKDGTFISQGTVVK